MEEENEDQIDLGEFLAKAGSLGLASAPWIVLGYSLINARRASGDMNPLFSGYVTNPMQINQQLSTTGGGSSISPTPNTYTYNVYTFNNQFLGSYSSENTAINVANEYYSATVQDTKGKVLYTSPSE